MWRQHKIFSHWGNRRNTFETKFSWPAKQFHKFSTNLDVFFDGWIDFKLTATEIKSSFFSKNELDGALKHYITIAELEHIYRLISLIILYTFSTCFCKNLRILPSTVGKPLIRNLSDSQQWKIKLWQDVGFPVRMKKWCAKYTDFSFIRIT